MAQEDNVYTIPKRINEPIMFAWFEVGNMLIVLVALALGMVTGLAVELILFSWVYLKFSSEIAKRFPKSHLKHMLMYYGIFPTTEKHKSTPDPLKREWFK